MGGGGVSMLLCSSCCKCATRLSISSSSFLTPRLAVQIREEGAAGHGRPHMRELGGAERLAERFEGRGRARSDAQQGSLAMLGRAESRQGRNKEQGQGRAESRQGRTLGRKLGRARQGGGRAE